MSKRVLDVGNCTPDHSSIKHFLTKHFDCEVVQAHGADDALPALRDGRFDLVLVNRKLDQDYSDGLEVIRKIKQAADLSHVPAMLVTNYDEHHEAAMKIGALRGFGKLDLAKPETVEKLTPILGQ
jgi:CheY-like chemotaxis protein